MMYSLQNYGILDFPLTYTGTIKTKSVKDFAKARKAIDLSRKERCKNTKAAFTMEDPQGIECPELDCVILGHARKFKHHKGTLDFREKLRTMLLDEKNKTTSLDSGGRWE